MTDQEIERNRQAIRVLNEHTAPEQMSKTCAIFQYSDSILSGLNSFIDSLPEETNGAASTMAPSCWGEEQGKVELVNDLEEDALLLERAWLTLDGFGHEELAERLRQFAERKGLIWK